MLGDKSTQEILELKDYLRLKTAECLYLEAFDMGKESNLLQGFSFKKSNKVYREKKVRIKTVCI